MPELSRFYGIIIKMYFNDTQQHHKPHIHAFYGDYEAVVAVDGDLLAGSIPAKQLKIIIGKAWNNAVRGEHFDKINPL